MTGTPLVVLDACVLANFSLCDTILRLAESPRLFEPKWSEEIIRETTRTLESKLGWPSTLTALFEAERLIPRMTNDEKDRHFVAAAVHGDAPIVVTFDLRHFGPEHLEPWGITALHPQSFPTGIFRHEQTLVTAKLEQPVPGFVSVVSDSIENRAPPLKPGH